jgi:hypothetical protein
VKILVYTNMTWVGLSAIMLIYFALPCMGMGQSAKEKMVGGPCSYKRYPGKAMIVSVKEKGPQKVMGGPPYTPYEVRFTFQTDQPIEEEFARVQGKERLLLLKNSWHPGPRFLEKYGIEAGKSFPCDLMVITRGTCTPIIFDFPTIDRADYFEAENK